MDDPTEPAAAILDARARFRDIFEQLNRDHGRDFATWRPTGEALHGPEGAAAMAPLPPARPFQLLLVPGLGASLAGPLGTPLADAAQHLRSLGHSVEVLKVRGFASSRRNARLIRDLLRESERQPDRPTIALGYSKGATDLVVAIATFPEVTRAVSAVVSLAGSIGGSPHADSLLGAAADRLYGALGRIGLGGLESLGQTKRRAWLKARELPGAVRLYSVVAHAGRERTSWVLRPAHERLRLLDPKNDSQVLRDDQILPGSTLLAELRADHWAAALPLTRRWPLLRRLGLDANDFPREILLEAILRFIAGDLDDAPPVTPPNGGGGG